MRNVYIFLNVLAIFVYLLRYEALVAITVEHGFVSFVGGVIISLALLVVVFVYGLYYLFLQSMVYPGASHFVRDFLFAATVPAWLVRYDFSLVAHDKILLASYVCFIFFFTIGGRVVGDGFVGYIAKIENKKGKKFPSVTPETFADLIPYHGLALLFVLMPIFARMYWATMVPS